MSSGPVPLLVICLSNKLVNEPKPLPETLFLDTLMAYSDRNYVRMGPGLIQYESVGPVLT